MNVGWPAIVLLLALMSNGRVAAQAKLTSSSLQTQFSAEDTGVEKPVVIPEEVMVILRQDEGVRNALKYENVPADKPPASWFSASEVHLRGSAQDDLVVLGEGDLRGANVITFWIFRDTDHGHELVLMAHAHDLIVRKNRWNEYREIEISGETAEEFTSVLFRFDGKRYAEYREKSEHIKYRLASWTDQVKRRLHSSGRVTNAHNEAATRPARLPQGRR